MQLLDLHHILLRTNNSQKTVDFYQSVLGLKLIKKEVNENSDNSHILTFTNNETFKPFVKIMTYNNLEEVSEISNSLTSIIFAIPKNSMEFWEKHLNSFSLKNYRIEEFGEVYLKFMDPFLHTILLVERDSLNNNLLDSEYILKQNAIISIAAVVLEKNDPNHFSEILENIGFNLIKTNYRFRRFYNGNIYIDLEQGNRKTLSGSISFLADDINQSIKLEDFNYYKEALNIINGIEEISISTNSFNFYLDEEKELLGEKLINAKKGNNLMPVYNDYVKVLKNYPYNDLKTFEAHLNHQNMLKRINELAKINKTRTLTNEEELERNTLRKEYVKSVTSGLKKIVEGVKVVDANGDLITFVKKDEKN